MLDCEIDPVRSESANRRSLGVFAEERSKPFVPHFFKVPISTERHQRQARKEMIATTSYVGKVFPVVWYVTSPYGRSPTTGTRAVFLSYLA